MNTFHCKNKTLCDKVSTHHITFEIESRFIKVEFDNRKYDHSVLLVLIR